MCLRPDYFFDRLSSVPLSALSGARLLFRLAADGSMKLERDDILPCENSGSFSMEPVVLREAGRN